MFDLIIIGMGISGITAAIYAKRSKMKVLLLDKSYPGGLLNKIDKISNYPGLIDISGPDFAHTLLEQITKMQIPYKIEEVIALDLNNNIKIVKTSKNEYKCQKVILALGRIPKYLGLDNEQMYLGQGISTSALTDAKIYQNEDIAVVGTGNSALQETLSLVQMAHKVYLLNRRDGFRGEAELVAQIKNNPKVQIIYNVTIQKINEENKKIKSITLSDGQILPIKGIFVYVGYKPDTKILKDYPILDDEDYIKVNENFETTIPHVYAIGDCLKKSVFQLVTAASDGAIVIHKMPKF